MQTVLTETWSRTVFIDSTSSNWILSEIAGAAGTGSSFKLTKVIIAQQGAGRSRAREWCGKAVVAERERERESVCVCVCVCVELSKTSKDLCDHQRHRTTKGKTTHYQGDRRRRASRTQSQLEAPQSRQHQSGIEKGHIWSLENTDSDITALLGRCFRRLSVCFGRWCLNTWLHVLAAGLCGPGTIRNHQEL